MGVCKKKKSADEKQPEEKIGKKWIWTALDTTTRLIVCYLIGDRTLVDARRFLKDLISRTEELPLFTSDELPHYADGLKELFHELVQPEPTGLRGRPRNPVKIVDKDLDYATVHKTRENGRVIKVESKIEAITIFSSGGGMIERTSKVKLKGLTDLKLIDIPVSFIPETLQIRINPGNILQFSTKKPTKVYITEQLNQD